MTVRAQRERYRIVSTLGSGGMATVQLAEDALLGRPVALKRVHAGGDPRGVSRLRREALIGASVSHPNLVSIYDIVNSTDGEQVIVMEYVRGETLADALARDRTLPAGRVVEILQGVAGALDAIHRQGIVHRDVKPANILLGSSGAVKLADLGIASVADGTRITTDGAVIGSFRYMAPEQIEGAPATPAVDVYALSTIAFEALSGQPARAGDNPLALATAIATQPPPDLRAVWRGAPQEVADLLAHGMAHDPSERPRSAGELVRGLGRALGPGAAVAATVPPSDAAERASAPRTARTIAMRPATLVGPRRSPPAASTAWSPRRARVRTSASLALAAVVIALAVILPARGKPHADHASAGTRPSHLTQAHHPGAVPITNPHPAAPSPGPAPPSRATTGSGLAPGAPPGHERHHHRHGPRDHRRRGPGAGPPPPPGPARGSDSQSD